MRRIFGQEILLQNLSIEIGFFKVKTVIPFLEASNLRRHNSVLIGRLKNKYYATHHSPKLKIDKGFSE
jgi:hypothetical protein